jgi:hypothetical protein
MRMNREVVDLKVRLIPDTRMRVKDDVYHRDHTMIIETPYGRRKGKRVE